MGRKKVQRMSPEEAVKLGIISEAEGKKIADGMRLGWSMRGLQTPVPPGAQESGQKHATAKSGKSGEGPASPVPLLAGKPRAYAPDSVPPQEQLFQALCERLPGLPEWEKKGLVPGRKFRADIFIPPNVVVEMDGYQHHTAKKAYQKDRKRNNLFVLNGYRVFHAYTGQVRSDELRHELVEQIAAAIEKPICRCPMHS